MPIFTHLDYLTRNRFAPKQIASPPAPDLNLVVVIPCHNEPDLTGTLEALVACERPEQSAEVIVVINHGQRHPEEVKAQNLRTLEEGNKWIAENQPDWLPIHLLYFPDLPRKHAGVGLARKIGMDEAVERLGAHDNQDGIILCFDADSRCDPNYLRAVEAGFAADPRRKACGIYFEHPLEGEYADEIYRGITLYELYLRVHTQGLKWAGFPYWHHTIGSSMAVRSSIYQAQGGMNRRKAGEDFYFLHKLMPLGGYFEVLDTRVIPSPRASDRVPFGTGKAIGDWLEVPKPGYPVYNRQSYADLKAFLAQVRKGLYEQKADDPDGFLADVPETVAAYLREQGFAEAVREAETHSKSEETFFKRFFAWFNGLKCLQFFHYARDHHYPNQPVTELAECLLEKMGEGQQKGLSPRELLLIYRELDRGEASL